MQAFSKRDIIKLIISEIFKTSLSDGKSILGVGTKCKHNSTGLEYTVIAQSPEIVIMLRPRGGTKKIDRPEFEKEYSLA
jgi:hypothetical protein